MPSSRPKTLDRLATEVSEAVPPRPECEREGERGGERERERRRMRKEGERVG